jgi:hypothetical protein
MSNENNEASPTPGEEQGEKETEEPRAKTPLERVREGQAKMRGNKTNSGRPSSEGDSTGPADSYKRRLHQRKSG